MSNSQGRRSRALTVVRSSQATGIAIVGLAAWSPHSADASVIYSGPVNAPVDTSTSYNVDFNHDGNTDAQFGNYNNNGANYLKLFLNNGSSPSHPQMLYDTVNNVAANLSPGTLIGSVPPDSSTNWTTDDKVLYDLTGGAPSGHFAPGSPGYAGLRFQSTTDATQLYYGWAQFQTIQGSPGGPSGTLIDFAYESTANTPIAAGDTGPVPEPGSLALLAAGAAGLATYRGRRNRTTVK